MNIPYDFNLNESIHFNCSEYSPLVLAYIGDAVMEIYVRTKMVINGNIPVNKLHIMTSLYVSAKGQSNMVELVMDILTSEEVNIYKRGRNAKSYSNPKNATVADYRRATGFEALIGYLYLKGENDRIKTILEKCIDIK